MSELTNVQKKINEIVREEAFWPHGVFITESFHKNLVFAIEPGLDLGFQVLLPVREILRQLEGGSDE